MKKSFLTSAALCSLFALVPTLAHAHPGHGTGFVSGLAHPLMGLDHVLAMAAVGLWAAQLGGRARWAVPATFIAMMCAGGVLGLAGFSMPYVDSTILGSVVVLGLLVATAARWPLAVGITVAGAFALAHGLAHGAEMPTAAGGAACIAGFAATTAALHGLGFGLAAMLQRSAQTAWIRAAGALVLVGGVCLAAA